MNSEHFQIAVVGSGFGGSLMAMIAHRLGFKTILIERGKHPRFAIGESSTPLANLLLEEIAEEYELSSVRPLCKWGTWQRQLPQVGCGLKRGFTFFHHEQGKAFAVDQKRERQLMVGASPNEEIADTHWYRPDFDQYLAEQAQKCGVKYLDQTVLDSAREEQDKMCLTGTRLGELIEVTADFVIDATGPRAFLHRALGLPEREFVGFPATQALFSHFRGVGPLPGEFIGIPESPPYPPEQAAVHHVFPGGWVWVLKFNNGITSAGVAATDELANELDFKSGEVAWNRLLALFPSLAKIFQSAKPIIPFIHSPRLTFRSGTVAGSHWCLLPSAAGFVDPLLSTGFALTLLGVKRLGQLLGSHWGKKSFQTALEDYSRVTLLEVDAAADLVGALYSTMDRFDLFKELSLLYFVAANFSETARRAGKIHLADSFLLCRHAVFGNQLRRICVMTRGARSVKEIAEMKRLIREAIEPFHVAGLTEDARHPWYPAKVEDLLMNSAKLQMSREEMAALLRKCGL